MADTVLSLPARTAKLANADLGAIHAAYVVRMNAAMTKAQRTASIPGAPASLWSAGLFLAAHGFDAADCAGDTYFGLGFASYRRFLAGIDGASLAAVIDDGRKVVFGTARRAGLIEAAPALAVAA